MSNRLAVVTIDGPAGAGKSTVARALAAKLGYVYLDTGAIYRCVALAARQSNIPWSDGGAVAALAEQIVAREGLKFTRAADGAQRVWLDGRDVSDAIRTPEISSGASEVSAHPPVRGALLGIHRAIAASGGVVTEGRDTGTVVFPSADVKFFLTASPEERAKRRCAELQGKGLAVDYDATLREIIERDRRDTERAIAPLCRAHDAIEVDTTGIPADEVIERMARVVTGP